MARQKGPYQDGAKGREERGTQGESESRGAVGDGGKELQVGSFVPLRMLDESQIIPGPRVCYARGAPLRYICIHMYLYRERRENNFCFVFRPKLLLLPVDTKERKSRLLFFL